MVVDSIGSAEASSPSATSIKGSDMKMFCEEEIFAVTKCGFGDVNAVTVVKQRIMANHLTADRVILVVLDVWYG